MVFTPPRYVPPSNLAIDTRDLNQGFNALGNALAQRRERAAMEAIGQAAQGGNMNALRDEALRRGKVRLGIQADNALRARQRAAQKGPGRVMNVGGTLVRIGEDGQPQVLYKPEESSLDNDLKRERLKQLRQGKQMSPLDNLKAQLLKQLMGGQQAPPQPQPGADPNLRLQSNQVEPGADPNLIRTQTAAPEAPPAEGGMLQGLTPEQKRGMALNMISPGLGTPLLNQGKSEQFGKPAVNDLEKKLLNAEEHYARVKDIAGQFNPEFLTFGGVAKGAWLKFRDKLNVGQLALNPQETQYLQQYSTFRQSSARNINLYIKEITGAQMSEKEADRITLGEANAGQGWFDGDSPTQYKAKLDNSLRLIRLSRMRYHYLRSGGFRGTAMAPEDIAKAMKSGRPPLSLPQMRSIYNKRHNQVLKSLRQQNPRASKQELDAQAIAQTNREFGI